MHYSEFEAHETPGTILNIFLKETAFHILYCYSPHKRSFRDPGGVGTDLGFVGSAKIGDWELAL